MTNKKLFRNDLIIICLLIVLALAGLIYFVNYTGYASLESRGGTITEIKIANILGNPEYWSGVHGVAVLVPEYNLPFSLDVYANKIHLGIFLFECFQRRIPHELYASLVNSTDLDWDTLQPATPEDVDAFLGINSTNSNVSATIMFRDNMTVQIGNRTFVVPSLYTRKLDENEPHTYDTGIMKDGNGNLVFVSHIYLYNMSLCYYGGLCNYQMLLPVRNCTYLINETTDCFTNPTNYKGYEHYYFFNDPTDYCPRGENPFLDYGNISGNVTDASGNPLNDVLIVVGEYGAMSNISNPISHYHIRMPVGEYYIFAVKSGYQTYLNKVNITFENMTFHNIIMQLMPIPNYNYNTQTHDFDYEYEIKPEIQMPARIEGQDFIISISSINKTIRMGEFIQEVINFQNLKNRTITVNIEINGAVKDLIQFDNKRLVIPPGETLPLVLTIFGKKEPGVYDGYLNVSGDINILIPITITIVKDRLPVEALLLDVEVYNKVVNIGDKVQFRTKLNNMLTAIPYPVSLKFTIQNKQGNETYWYDTANINLITSFSIFKEVKILDRMKPGDYVVRVTAEYLDLSSSASDSFQVVIPVYMFNILGFPVWKWLLLLLMLLLAYLTYRLIKKYIRSKKKYDVPIDISSLPKKDKNALYVGLLAETKIKAYLNIDNLTTHMIVAGSTGGGKSFSVQVIVEEVLQKRKSVLVFDPTGQWTGFLKKLTDKTLLRKYPEFDMDKNMAKGSDGNIKLINNPYEEIDLKKFIKPGEIQIFVLNRLRPEEIDIFIGNTIMQVFNQKFEESRELKTLLVYDEVHRLLPKFGGSGVGLLQLERGCREFRKWGIGLVMISQVLGDFVEEIRANIGTEIQMRTRDENDLQRIKEKYSDIFEKALLRSVVGTGMIQNAEYNNGRPYYITFRPIMHSIQKLSEEELNKYSELNDTLLDIEYQIEQLEKEKQDIFDLQLELRLAYDKLRTGAFSIVEVYLEGLIPKIDNIWKKLGKKPLKREVKLIDTKIMEQEMKKAEEARKRYEQNAQQEIIPKDNTNDLQKIPNSNHPNTELQINEKKSTSNITDNGFPKFEYSLPITRAITFNDGQSATSLSELIDVLDGMTVSTFKNHVSKQKNDIAEWIKKEFNDDNLSKKLEKSTKKEEMIKLLNTEKSKNEKIIFKDENTKDNLKTTEKSFTLKKEPGPIIDNKNLDEKFVKSELETQQKTDKIKNDLLSELTESEQHISSNKTKKKRKSLFGFLFNRKKSEIKQDGDFDSDQKTAQEIKITEKQVRDNKLQKISGEQINKSILGFLKSNKNSLSTNKKKKDNLMPELLIHEPSTLKETKELLSEGINIKDNKDKKEEKKSILKTENIDQTRIFNLSDTLNYKTEESNENLIKKDEETLKKEIETRLKEELSKQLKKEFENNLRREIEARIRREIEDEYNRKQSEQKLDVSGVTKVQISETSTENPKRPSEKIEPVVENKKSSQDKEKTLEKRFSDIDFTKINAEELKYRADSLETIDEKIFLLEKGEKYFDSDPNIKFSLAVLYQLKTDYENAEKQYKKILQISPNNIEIMMRLGLVLKHEKKYDEAIDYVRRVLVIEPKNIKAKMLLEQLEGEKAL